MSAKKETGNLGHAELSPSRARIEPAVLKLCAKTIAASALFITLSA
jgi:hypothetical protein